MRKLTFDKNNDGILSVEQKKHDGSIQVSTGEKISAGDFVMLLNYYRYVKNNDIQNDFINYWGKKKNI